MFSSKIIYKKFTNIIEKMNTENEIYTDREKKTRDLIGFVLEFEYLKKTGNIYPK